MTIRELMQDETKYLVDENMLLGHIAMWAVRQSPYVMPDGLDCVLSTLKESRIPKDWEGGVDSLRMKRFTFKELEVWIRENMFEHPSVEDWNKPKRLDAAPGPDHGFIDLYALCRNITGSVINEIIAEAQ